MSIKEIYIFGNKLVIYELDDVCDSVSGRALTGSWIWDSALLLSNWIATHRQTFEFAGKTVLELGAGTGLPGMTAARLGAKRVILTDIEPLVPGLRKSVEANGLGERVWVSRLVWGCDELPSRLVESGEVDAVLMSDVLFDAEEMAGLAKTLKEVCGEGTKVWAATEVRESTSDCLAELEEEGFGIVELPSQLGGESLDCFDNFAVFQLIPPKQTQFEDHSAQMEE
ncbi:PREDICTED: methyltransferase-like protein 23 [Ipomoea nil]|uniref:methyltransferase-like protein 23 n=1 Tax=Ipomoea nil TaxID=35883 RepID=UPI000900CCA2|nr:PREDICTED: methyltransferase-like protein 23 [Ipomoea nil]